MGLWRGPERRREAGGRVAGYLLCCHIGRNVVAAVGRVSVQKSFVGVCVGGLLGEVLI